MGGFHYWPDPPAGPGPTVVCKCGHPLAAHSGSGVAGVPCKVCGATAQGLPTGRCMGWEPAGATTTTEPPAGPPDLTHAIQAATDLLFRASTGDRVRCRRLARICVEAAAWPLWERDLRAVHAELAVLRHSTAMMRDLTREQDQALQATRDRLADLEALLRELHERGPTRALHAKITAALDQTAPREEGQ